jgi:spermidine synthase
VPPKRAEGKLPPATISEIDGVRHLHLGTPWVQGSMRIGKPRAIELEYVQRMMVWMLLRTPQELTRGHALQLGLGAAAITRFTHQVLRMKTIAVELNPAVIGACRAWFHLPRDDARLTVVEADAGAWVADAAHAESADVLCIDLYDHEAAAPVLDDAVFYADCRRVLTDGGVMSVNLFGRNASFARSARRIAAAFGTARVRSLRPTREGNTVLFALKGADMPDRTTLTARAEVVESRYGLPARKWLRMMRELPGAGEA